MEVLSVPHSIEGELPMALSLNSHQPESAVHSQTQLKTTSLSYSTPRKFSVSAVENGISQEILPAMSKSQMAPLLLLPSNFEHASTGMVMHKVTPPSQGLPDLPSWTPLRVLEDGEGSSASEVDEPSTVVSAGRSETTRTSPRTASEHPDSSGLASPVNSSSLPSHPKRDARKKARFAGVVITSKRRRPPQSDAPQTRPAPRREAASKPTTLSLVDALRRTFDANTHVEVSSPPSLPRRPGRFRTAQEQDHDASTTPGPQTDVTTSTEPEDEMLQLNNRLLAPRTPKKRLTRARAIALSESNNDSEDARSVSRDTSVHPERTVKRLKPIAYDAYAALIDATLGTVQAPISWNAEPDFITKDVPIFRQSQPPERPSTDVPMNVDDETYTARHAGQDVAAPPGQAGVAGDPQRRPALRLPQKAVLSPHIPRGDKFKERLVAVFGENATVRMDKAARPKPAAIDLFASLDELDREPSPNPSESSASESASTTEELMSTIPSTQLTSQSPELLPTNFPSALHAMSETSKEQISGWIAALQRLVKGKVRVHDEDLEMLSVVLAEIESVKDSLDARGSMITELHTSLKQLSELEEIPFGDRNNLRPRAGKILLGWPSSA